MTAAALAWSCGTELPPNSKFCNECGAAVATTTTPAETLLDRGANGDVTDAEAAIARFAAAPAHDRLVIREIWLQRLRALLARAHNDETSYRHYRDRHRDLATSLGFKGHIAWAEAMR